MIRVSLNFRPNIPHKLLVKTCGLAFTLFYLSQMKFNAEKKESTPYLDKIMDKSEPSLLLNLLILVCIAMF